MNCHHEDGWNGDERTHAQDDGGDDFDEADVSLCNSVMEEMQSLHDQQSRVSFFRRQEIHISLHVIKNIDSIQTDHS